VTHRFAEKTTTMEWNWFDSHWPWIGLAMSAVLLVLLLATNIFRSDRSKSRWFDPVWLAWPAGCERFAPIARWASRKLGMTS
jgi:hypothetical protein